MRSSPTCSFFFSFLIILSCYITTTAPLPEVHPSVPFPTTNLTKDSTNKYESYYAEDSSNSYSIFILLRGTNGGNFACGFYSMRPYTSFLFAIFIVNRTDFYNFSPQVVWSANRDHPVGENAVLNLTATGELVLQDSDGTIAWSAGKSVASMNLTETGNLVLFNDRNSVVWQSFAHPTDCLLPGQKLFEGQKLKSSVSLTNWTSQGGMFSLQVKYNGLFGYFESNPPQRYYSDFNYREKKYVTFFNGMLFYSGRKFNSTIYTFKASSAQFPYLKLMSDGHLKLVELQKDNGWVAVADVTDARVGNCGNPMFCGTNAICFGSNQCMCPKNNSFLNYFTAVSDQPILGCLPLTPLTCNSKQDQYFITLEYVEHFAKTAEKVSVDMENCKRACLNNCSCKAAFFYSNDPDASNSGDVCYLVSEPFTMRVTYVHQTAFIKVQDALPASTSQIPSPLPKRNTRVGMIVGLIIATSTLLLSAVAGFIVFIVRRKRNPELEEEYLDQVPGMPNRFSYEELKTATDNFSKKLGEGGYGYVFEGTLVDGTKIEVKCLEGLSRAKKSFLAEVQSIGSIHHVNLVRLQGFCAWKSQRLLVYDFMSNGSLDRWIYHGIRDRILEWECRKKIILDIAKGLAYLHEDCRQKIVHLDIKPQNILLDDDFNAKVSDFGLSKLIDKSQTEVMTTIKGREVIY